MNHASPALRRVATDMGACQAEVISEKLDKKRSAFDMSADVAAVYVHGNVHDDDDPPWARSAEYACPGRSAESMVTLSCCGQVSPYDAMNVNCSRQFVVPFSGSSCRIRPCYHLTTRDVSLNSKRGSRPSSCGFPASHRGAATQHSARHFSRLSASWSALSMWSLVMYGTKPRRSPASRLA